MDTLTHALSGALLARATAPADRPGETIPLARRVAIGFVAAALPDLDIVVAWISPLAYLYHHRGVTHSFVLLPLWAAALAWLCAKLWRGGPGWRAYFGVIALGIGIHIVGDWITSFGTMLLAPLTDQRFALSTTFIIDLWFTGIIAAGLVAATVWRTSRVPATVGLVALAGYVAFQAVQRQRAIEFGEAHARANDLASARVTALPRPVSPFNWVVVVEDADRIDHAQVNLLRTERFVPAPDAGFVDRLSAAYLPLTHAQWTTAHRFGPEATRPLAREVWSAPAFEFFRWFAAYPSFYRVDPGNPSTCVWFEDLRFVTPGRGTVPFRYGLCREGTSPWRPYELDGDTRLPVH